MNKKTKEVLAIIPARSGSKRIPDKNIKHLAGRPLVEYTIISAAVCDRIDHVVISSDIPSLERYVDKYGHFSYHRRAEHLCGDKIGDMAVIRDVLDAYGYDWDLVVYLRPTTPIRADYHLCQAIDQMIAADVNATGLRSVELMAESAYKCFELPCYLAPISCNGKDMTDYPNQMVPPTYRPNGYIDICKPETIKRKVLWGDWVIGYITPRTLEIDTMDDWNYAEYLMQRTVDTPVRFGRRTVETN